MKTYPRINESRVVEKRTFSCVDPRGTFGGEYVVRAYSVITTDLVVVEAWEPVDGARSSLTSMTHTTVTHTGEHGYLGLVTSRRLPAEIEAMEPGSPERIGAARRFQAWREAEALDVIRAAYPGIGAVAKTDGGRMTCTIDEFQQATA